MIFHIDKCEVREKKVYDAHPSCMEYEVWEKVHVVESLFAIALPSTRSWSSVILYNFLVLFGNYEFCTLFKCFSFSHSRSLSLCLSFSLLLFFFFFCILILVDFMRVFFNFPLFASIFVSFSSGWYANPENDIRVLSKSFRCSIFFSVHIISFPFPRPFFLQYNDGFYKMMTVEIQTNNLQKKMNNY